MTASVVLDPRGEPDRSVAVIRKPQTQKDITALNTLVYATFPLVAFNSLCIPRPPPSPILPPTKNLNINMGAGGAFRPSPGWGGGPCLGCLKGLGAAQTPLPHGGQPPWAET